MYWDYPLTRLVYALQLTRLALLLAPLLPVGMCNVQDRFVIAAWELPLQLELVVPSCTFGCYNKSHSQSECYCLPWQVVPSELMLSLSKLQFQWRFQKQVQTCRHLSLFFFKVDVSNLTHIVSDMTFVFMLIQLARHMGTILGVSATSSVTQASLKILLHERFKGPDAEQVRI